MIGRSNGLTAALKQLILSALHRTANSFQQLSFCLVYGSPTEPHHKRFLDSEGINVVKAFCDWFSDRTRQQSYKTFLSQTAVSQKTKKVPQPSATRWLFYRDVIKAKMSQHSLVEEFIKYHEGFESFWNSLKLDKEKFGLHVEKRLSFLTTSSCLFQLSIGFLSCLGE